MKELLIEGNRVIYKEEFAITAGDFASAGEASAAIKQRLKKIGINKTLIRRVAIAAYEAELNMVIHSDGGMMTLVLEPTSVMLRCDDVGPGIPDIALAMTEGYSTASESIRMMGFGAGMGLPNINKNCDQFDIESSSAGTHMAMHFNL